MSSRRVTSGGVAYHVTDHGAGEPVLLLHGFPETSRSFQHNIDALVGARRRVLTVDLKGYGGTDKPPPGTPGGDYRMSTVSAEIGALIGELGFGAIDLVGHDWGGIIVSAMFLTARDRIRRAVIINAPFRRFVPWRPRHVYLFNLPSLPERRFYRHPMAFVGGIFDHWCERREAITAEDLRVYVRGLQTDGSISCALGYYRSLRKDLRFIARAQVHRMRDPPPTMIVFGTGDPILPPVVARMAAKDIPGSRLELIDGAGHFVHSEAPNVVNRKLVSFLAPGTGGRKGAALAG